MKKICLVARQNIKKPNGGGYHNDEGRYALDGICIENIEYIPPDESKDTYEDLPF